MENCFVTKLNGRVNNNSLFKKDEFFFLQKLNVSADPSFTRLDIWTPRDATLQISARENTVSCTNNGSAITLPYTQAANTEGKYIFSNSAEDSCHVSVSNKKNIHTLTIRYADIISDSFITFQEYNSIIEIIMYFTSIQGSLLDVVPLTALEKFCIDRPTCKIKDGNIRNFMNAYAAKRLSDNILTSIRVGFNDNNESGNISDIPAAFNGTYVNNYSTVYFTTDTTTYPHGWYAKRPDNKWYNANDEEIEAPE